MIEALYAQSLFSPVAGVLGDRFNRMHIIVFGCLCWAIFTLLLDSPGILPRSVPSHPLQKTHCV